MGYIMLSFSVQLMHVFHNHCAKKTSLIVWRLCQKSARLTEQLYWTKGVIHFPV